MPDNHTGETNPGAISEKTPIDLRVVVMLVGLVLSLAGGWFGMEAKVTAANVRIDMLETKQGQQIHLLCKIADKLKVDTGDCP